jgi:hypothetical protein
LTGGHFSVRMNVAYKHAEVAELADAADSKSAAREGVGVRLPSSAPRIPGHPGIFYFGSWGQFWGQHWLAIKQKAPLMERPEINVMGLVLHYGSH